MERNALDPIRHQINSGDRQAARIALVELLDAEPDNADAWALLAILLGHPAEQAQCYREILRINPGDRQAEMWLESLTAQLTEPPASPQPLVQEPSGQSCPRCGAMVRVSPLRGAPRGQIVCPYCGFHIEPDDAFEDGESVRKDEPLRRAEGPGPEPAAERENLDQLLDRVSLPDLDYETRELEREMLPRRAEQKGFLNGLLGRLRGSPVEPEAEDLVLSQGESPSGAGALSPELILRLAGGPLAPEERRNCPQCGAVVSRREPKCPWCSAPLPDAEAR